MDISTLGALHGNLVMRQMGMAGRNAGTISVSLQHETPNYVLAIDDNGKGIAEEPASGSLGLTIIRSLAAQLGGEVSWVASGGTTARVAFPAQSSG